MTSTIAAPATTGAPYLIDIDPRKVWPHPGNRKDFGDLRALKATIINGELVQFPVVAPEADGFQLVAGGRRRAAAIEAIESGQWPADRVDADGNPVMTMIVRPDFAGMPIEQVMAILNENDDEQRKALNATERADAYAQLAAFDISEAEMARRTGKKAPEVRAALKLTTMSEQVRGYADAGQLTFDDLAQLAEFEDDEKVVARILKDVSSPWGFRHKFAEERRRRTRKAWVDTQRAELKAAGVKVIGLPANWPMGCRATDLRRLVDAEGNTPDAEQVKKLDGYAAIIDRDNNSLIYVCLDPEVKGYQRVGNTWFKTDAEQAQAAARDRANDERRTAHADARAVRREFMVETWGSAKAAKALLIDALHTAATDPAELGRVNHDLVATLAGGMTDDLARAKADRLNRVLVARYLAAQEEHLCETIGRGLDRWTRDPAQAMAWLDRLAAAGYELSEVETETHTAIAALLAQREQAQREKEQAEREAQEQEQEKEQAERESQDGADETAAADDEEDQATDETAAPIAA